MDLGRCYKWYAEYFRIIFPFAAPPTYQEWLKDILATSAAGVSSTMDIKELSWMSHRVIRF